MALDKQVVSVPMSLGIDTENAPPLIDKERFSALSNVVFNKDSKGQLHKRSGHTSLGNSLQGGGTTPPAALVEVFNDELGTICYDTNLYAYSPTNSNWVKRGSVPMIQQSETNVSSGAFSVANADACYIGGLAFYVFEMNGSAWVKVVDDSNKAVKLTAQLKSTSGLLYTPKILSNGTDAVIIATDSTGSIWFVKVISATLTISYTNTTILADVVSNESSFDATVNGGVIYIAYVVSSILKGITYNASTLAYVAGPVTIAPTVIAPAPVSVAAVGSNVYVTWQNAQNAAINPGFVEFQQYTSSSWTAGTSGAVSLTTVAACPRLTSGSVISGGVPVYVAFYETAPAGANILSTITYYISGTRITWATGTNISGQPFSVGTNLYLPVIYPSAVQQTLFLTFQAITSTPANALAQVAGRYFSANNAGAPSSNFRIAAPFNVTSTTASLPAMVQPQGASAATVAASLAELSLGFSTLAQFSQLGGTQHIACGSQLMDYDGTNLVEHNFHLYPEAPIISYLTSQLTVVTDGYDPNFQAPGGGLVQGKYRLMVPDNAANPGGPVGQLIQPGEYITFYADSSPSGAGVSAWVIYFVVNGVGSAPTGLGAATATACAIQTTMTATQVAQALFVTMNSIANFNITYSVSYTPSTQTNTATPQTINLTNAGLATQAAMPPVSSLYGDARQVYIGTFSATTATVGLSFPPASLISTGQYCQFTASSTFFTNSKTIIYAWFSNPSNPTVGNEVKTGGDPKPFGTLANGPTLVGNGSQPQALTTWSNSVGPGNYIGVEVVLLGTETPTQVALAVANALNAIRTSGAGSTPAFNLGNGTFSAAQQSNTVCVQYNIFSAGQIGPADYPITNVGRNYVGAVIAGSTQPYAAIEYSSVYEWIDSQNQLHESAPSVPAIAYIPTYQATGTGTANNVIAPTSAAPVSAVVGVGTQPLSLTQKTSAIVGTDLDIAIYRTISGATVGNQVFYRITPTNSLLFNQPNATTAITYADFSSDGVGVGALAVGSQATGIQANQTLYTTGGVQPNACPPACSYIINHQNRLWLSGLENPNAIWYSEELNDGFGMSFTSLQTAVINPTVGQTTGGPIVALASMDSNLIIFQENQVWFIQGNGPDPTGGNGFFSTPQIVASSSKIGCRDVNSVVLQPNGVMFKSTQGYWLLSRQLQLQYIGAAVKTYNSDVVSSAIALSSNSQINFLSASGTTLMYDWYYDSWSTFTTNGTDSVVDAFGNFTMVTSTGSVWQQTPGSYYDGDGSPVIMSVTTAWLKPSAIQGYGRVWRAFLEGQFYGSQPYSIKIAYNYNNNIVDNFTLNAGAGTSGIGLWGGSTTWGASIWGEDGGIVVSYPDQIQIVTYPSNQSCESIQFTITDQSPVPQTQTWSLNALDLEIGVRRGGFKRTGNQQRVGG